MGVFPGSREWGRRGKHGNNETTANCLLEIVVGNYDGHFRVPSLSFP